MKENRFPELEERLAPLAVSLGKPRPGDWLWEHDEPGQTFDAYRASHPVRKGPRWHTIHVCLVGDFTVEERQVLDVTRDYLALFFDSPIHRGRDIPLADVPAHGRRRHPDGEDEQLLTSYLLNEVLGPTLPDDALAYLAFTGCDLWPGEGWNFVFGEASSALRSGIWSLYRNGDPSEGPDAFRLCLRRTLSTAAHETGHILGMEHCTAYECLMNGCNSMDESDRQPLHLCPVCLRKLCWNLQAEPLPYLERLATFCGRYGLAEAEGYRRVVTMLQRL